MTDENDQTNGALTGMSDVLAMASPSSNYKTRGKQDAPDGTGVLGQNTAATGIAHGIEGFVESLGAGAAGVYGEATSSSGETNGVHGVTQSIDPDATGVKAEARNGSSVAVRARARNGGHGVDTSTDAQGNYAVWARHVGSAGGSNDHAVRGETYTNADGAAGVSGTDGFAGSGATYGVKGETFSSTTDAAGVRGLSTQGSGTTYGVKGTIESEAFDAAGIYGESTAMSGNGRGVEGVSQGPAGVGVSGRAPNGGTGVYAEAGGPGKAISAADEVLVDDRMDVKADISDQYAPNLDNYPLAVENTNGDSLGNLVLALKTGVVGDPDTTHNFVQFLSADGNGGAEFNGTIQGDDAGGVTYETSGADYAEYLPKLDPGASIESGDVVGVFGEAISHRTDGAARVLVVSEAPNVVGNAPDPGDEDDHEKVAFTGQVPVKVRGQVEDGDLLVPSGEGDGIAVAVAPAERDPGTPIVGQSWERDDSEGVSEVTAAIGIDDPAVVGASLGPTVERQAERIDELAEENQQLREDLAERDDRIDDLERRLAALEATVDTTATPADD